jgi:RNA polymerase sigma factor (sigma-70 family)
MTKRTFLMRAAGRALRHRNYRLFFAGQSIPRHCYRMLGSFADAEDLVQDVLLRAWRSRETYAGEVPLDHWLFRIATTACLNELARRKRRGLPQLERPPARPTDPLEDVESADWLTPAPDAKLFDGPARALETRESVALAFLALFAASAAAPARGSLAQGRRRLVG